MRSICRISPTLGLALACAVFLAFLVSAEAGAAPPVSGAVGGSWQTVEDPPLAGQRINALLPDGRGGLWVGLEERGLASWDGARWRTIGPRDGLPDSRIVALFLDSQKRLWVSTGGGLGYLPSEGGPFRRIGLNGLRALPVLAFAQAPDGAVLLGSAKGLDAWQPDGGLQSVPELDGQAVLALHTDMNGVVWAGTAAGLWRGVDGKWQPETRAGAGRVAAISENRDGSLYVAGESGLWQSRAGEWRKLAVLASGEMTAIATRDGNVWLGTSQGVAGGQEDVWESYDPNFLPAARVTAMLVGDDGAVWIGTTGGLVSYLPDAKPPQVEIAGVNGLRLESSSLRLRSDRIDRIDITASDEVTPRKRLRIYTRLEGVDPAPRLLTPGERGDLRAISVYSHRPLAPGTYALRVWAQDDAFNRSPESQVTIIVPQLAQVPGGLSVRRDTAFAGLAGLALVLTAGATTTAAARTRRRQIQRRVEAAAAHIRAVEARLEELFVRPLPLREREVREAVAALKRENVLLLGDRGSGKTTTLRALAAALPGAGDRSTVVAAASLDLQTVPEANFFYGLMSAASDALNSFVVGTRPRLRWSEGETASYGEQEFSADLGLMLARLQPQLGRRLTVVLLLDNADALDRYEGRHRDAFRRLVVASSVPDSPVRLALAAQKTPEALAGFSDLFHAVVLAPLSPAQAERLLREGALGMLEWESAAERVAIKRAGGNPARLSTLGRGAAEAALADGRLCITGSDVP